MKSNVSHVDGTPRRKRNVIWIFGDQHRGQALGYRGDPNVATPVIDGLAASGMRFDKAVSGTPWCAPFRASLLTGMYPHQHGVVATPGALDPTIPTITKPFKDAGYHTAWIGKWHIDGSNSREHIVGPEYRGGFDFWMGYENNNSQHECYVYGTGQEKPQRLRGYETDALTDIFLDHLESHVTMDNEYQPFFAALSVQPPHPPYVGPIEDRPEVKGSADITLRPNVPLVDAIRKRAAVDIAGYSRMISNLDMNIGRIVQALIELGIDRETYIVFFSDHGDMLGSHGLWNKSVPYEESIRIPFIVAMAGGRYHINVGESDAVLNHVDIAPTTLGLCGIEQPEYMVGFDYSSTITANAGLQVETAPGTEPESAYLQQIVRKLHPGTVYERWRGVVTRDGWKYVVMPGHPWLLFNLNVDPYEQANLAFDVAHAAQRKRCHTALEEWISRTEDAFPLPEII